MRIPLGSDGNGSVDLRDVAAAVGPQDHLTWVLRGVWVIGDLRRVDGASTLEERSWLDQGAELDWSSVQQIATDCDQVVDGYFTGYDAAGRPQLELAAVDSSWWKVWARDPGTVARVRAAFAVTTEDHPDPDPVPEPRRA